MKCTAASIGSSHYVIFHFLQADREKNLSYWQTGKKEVKYKYYLKKGEQLCHFKGIRNHFKQKCQNILTKCLNDSIMKVSRKRMLI